MEHCLKGGKYQGDEPRPEVNMQIPWAVVGAVVF